jgi:hypothetical protein
VSSYLCVYAQTDEKTSSRQFYSVSLVLLGTAQTQSESERASESKKKNVSPFHDTIISPFY